MPIYDYVCKNPNCKEKFTFFHLTKDEVDECPKCASKNNDRDVSPGSSHQLKGSGWARDNYGLKKRR